MRARSFVIVAMLTTAGFAAGFGAARAVESAPYKTPTVGVTEGIGSRVAAAAVTPQLKAPAHHARVVAATPDYVRRGDLLLADTNPVATLFPVDGRPPLRSSIVLPDAGKYRQVPSASARGVYASMQAVPQSRSAVDYLLLMLVGLMLVAYQLCRKHRFLRPQPFSL